MATMGDHAAGLPTVKERLSAHFERLKSLQGAELLRALPAFVNYIEREPVLAAIARSLELDLEARVDAFSEHDAKSVATLRAAWAARSQWILQMWDAKCETMGTAAREAYGDPRRFEGSLLARATGLPPFLAPASDESVTGPATDQLGHYLAVIADNAARSEHAATFSELLCALSTIREEHARASRQYLLDASTLAGAALKRIRRIARGLVPAVVGWDPLASIPAMLDKAAHWWTESQVSISLFERTTEDQARLQQYVEQTRRDLATIAFDLFDRLLERDASRVQQLEKAAGSVQPSVPAQPRNKLMTDDKGEILVELARSVEEKKVFPRRDRFVASQRMRVASFDELERERILDCWQGTYTTWSIRALLSIEADVPFAAQELACARSVLSELVHLYADTLTEIHQVAGLQRRLASYDESELRRALIVLGNLPIFHRLAVCIPNTADDDFGLREEVLRTDPRSVFSVSPAVRIEAESVRGEAEAGSRPPSSVKATHAAPSDGRASTPNPNDTPKVF